MKPFAIFHNAVRAKEIVTTLLRYGFDDLLAKIETPHGWFSRLVAPKTEGLNTWQRTRRACEDLGPTFVKLAQLLGSRPDVLPQPLIEEFKLLRNRVKPVPFEEIKPILEKELESSLENIFDHFDQEACAAGSIGQIHRARLKGEGREVAVKIQRPDIRSDVEADFELIGWFARQIHQKVDELRAYDLPAVIEEAKVGLMNELDFRNEANNATLFNNLNEFPERVFAPEVHDLFTTPHLLITDWVEGKPPNEIEVTQEQGADLAEAGGNSLFHQIVIAGFFHADPHTGNILITPNHQVCFLDWGLAGQLTRFMRYFLADLLSAITSQDAEKVVRVAARMSRSNRFIDTIEMEKQVTIILRRYQKVAITGDAIGNLILDMLYIFGRNGINVTKDYTMLAKAVASIEETARSLDPNFKLAAAAKPFLEQLSMERWNPASILRESWWFVFSAARKLQELPGDVQRVLRRIESEDLSVKLHHEGLSRLDELLGSVANRLVLAIILASLIVGSSMIITTGVEPLLFGFPAIGLIGYVISGVLGLWIVWDILRHGRHK